MRTKYFKWGNPLFIVFLAIAGLFGVSSALVGAHAKEAPVAEEAKAVSDGYKYITGSSPSLDGWANDGQFEMVTATNSNYYVYKSLELAANTQFKITNMTWTDAKGASYLLNKSSGNFSEGNDGNIGCWTDGTYDIVWDGTNVIVTDDDAVDLSGYQGWVIAGSGTSFSGTSWKPSSSIHLDDDAGSYIAKKDNISMTSGDEFRVAYSMGTYFTDDGWKDWASGLAGFTVSSNNIILDNTSLVDIYVDTSYIAHASSNFTITYRDMGDEDYSGSNIGDLPSRHTYGVQTTLVNGTKTNYGFGGWYTNISCSGEPVTTLTATGYTANITLYAKWVVDTYTINYSAKGADSGEPAVTSESPTIDIPFTTSRVGTMVKTGYALTGWHGDNGVDYGVDQQYAPLAANTVLNMDPIWSIVDYSITYYDSYGAAFSGTHQTGYPTSYNYGTGATLDTPTKTGYSFGGYYTSPNCSGKAVTSIGSSETGNKTYYTKWNELTSTFMITFNGGSTKEALNTVVSSSEEGVLYQLTPSNNSHKVWGGDKLGFYKDDVLLDDSVITGSGNITTFNDGFWSIHNYDPTATIFFKIKSDGNYAFWLSGHLNPQGTYGPVSGTTFYIKDSIKESGQETNYSAGGCNVAAYFFNPVNESPNISAWTTFAVKDSAKSTDTIDIYSLTVPQFDGHDIQWGGVIIARFLPEVDPSDISMETKVSNNGANLSFTSDTQNCIEITTWTGSGDEVYPSICNGNLLIDGGYSSGAGVYIDVSNAYGTTWDTSISKYAIYFWGVLDETGEVDESKNAWSSWMTLVPNQTTIFEAEVPQCGGQDVTWAKIIAVRNVNTAEDPSFDGENVDQTHDFWLSQTLSGYQLIKFNNALDTQMKQSAYLSTDFTDDSRVNIWGSRFLSNVTCDNGANPPSVDKWNSMGTEYGAMSRNAKGIITNAIKDESGCNYEKAVARYDYISQKYNTKTSKTYTDFANREESGQFTLSANRGFSIYSLFNSDGNINFSTLIVIISSSVALISVAGLSILMVKKIKSKEL